MAGRPPIEGSEAAGPARAVVLADDPLVRDSLAETLSAAGMEVAASVESASVALFDTGADPDEAEERIAELASLTVPAVVLVGDSDLVRTALAAGARGVVERRANGGRLRAALEAVHLGLTVIDGTYAEISAGPVEASSGGGVAAFELTPREREVLELLAAGLSNKRIASRLQISEHTAKFHVNGILGKLGAATRTEAVVVAAKRGLLLL